MNVKIVVMDQVYNIDGTVYQDELCYILNNLYDYASSYINTSLIAVYEHRLMGLSLKKDIVGELRRGILFLTLVKKEMINDAKNLVQNESNHYVEKYDLEGFRDYLVCQGVDSDIVDGIYNIIDFVYIIPGEEDGDGGVPLPPEDAGIGNMQIEGTVNPFKIY